MVGKVTYLAALVELDDDRQRALVGRTCTSLVSTTNEDQRGTSLALRVGLPGRNLVLDPDFLSVFVGAHDIG